MILLDTNVISEPWLPQPSKSVMDWLNSQAIQDLYICTPVLAELRFGIERLAEGARKARLNSASERLVNEVYRGRILNFDTASALHFGIITAKREQMGRRMEPLDAQIAAIALAHQMTLVTRDTTDFRDIGLELIDPFATKIV